MLRRLAASLSLILLVASCCLAASPQPVGMLSSTGVGAVVAGVKVPSGTAVYKGDVIEARLGSAVFTLSSGASLTVTPNSSVRVVDSASVELLRGMSRVESRVSGLTVRASNWVLDAKSNTRADVVFESGAISLMIGQGQVSAKNTVTKQVLVADNSRPILLPAAGAPAPQQPPTQPAGQGPQTSGTSAKEIGLYALAGAGLVVGIAAIATRGDNASKSSVSGLQSQLAGVQADNATLKTQLAAAQASLTSLSAASASLTTTVNTLKAQLTTLSAQASALAASSQTAAALNAQLNDTLNKLLAAQGQLATAQSEINTLIAQVVAGTPLTPAQQTQLAQLQKTVSSLTGTVSGLSITAADLAGQIAKLPPPPPISPTGP